jgi:signal transduction histidine kinase
MTTDRGSRNVEVVSARGVRLPDWFVDVVVVAICLVVDVSVVLDQAGTERPASAATAAGVTAAVVGPLALWWRRRRPTLSVGAVVLSGAVLWAAGFAPVGHGVSVIVAVYSVAAWSERRVSVPSLGLVLTAVVAHQLATWWVDGFSLAGNLVLLVGAWWLGDGARRRRREAMAHAERAAQLDAARSELASKAVADERLRIARELHDVVAHAMSAIAVQAGTGRVAFDREPNVAREALARIESLSRLALSDMRQLLVVLRPDHAGAVDRAPMVSLDDLDGLVATTGAAGVEVGLRIEGQPRPLPAAVDVAAYRIVQEALTNVARHAHTDRADVSICYGTDAVIVAVDDDGGAGPPSGDREGRPGVGIIGMRERVAACGGTLVAGAKPSGGFRVLARLPITRSPAEPG